MNEHEQAASRSGTSDRGGGDRTRARKARRTDPTIDNCNMAVGFIASELPDSVTHELARDAIRQVFGSGHIGQESPRHTLLEHVLTEAENDTGWSGIVDPNLWSKINEIIQAAPKWPVRCRNENNALKGCRPIPPKGWINNWSVPLYDTQQPQNRATVMANCVPLPLTLFVEWTCTMED